MKIHHVPATTERAAAKPAVRRATRHPASGWGWLWLQPKEAELFETEDRPSLQHPDHHISGQNPEFTSWAIELTKTFANDPHYRPQFDARLEYIDGKIKSSLKELQGIAAEVDKLQEERLQVAELITTDGQPQLSDKALPVDII